MPQFYVNYNIIGKLLELKPVKPNQFAHVSAIIQSNPLLPMSCMAEHFVFYLHRENDFVTFSRYYDEIC